MRSLCGRRLAFRDAARRGAALWMIAGHPARQALGITEWPAVGAPFGW